VDTVVGASDTKEGARRTGVKHGMMYDSRRGSKRRETGVLVSIHGGVIGLVGFGGTDVSRL